MEKIAQNITNSIQHNNANLTDLQIIKIKFGLQCLLGETSKILIYLIIFSVFSLTQYLLISLFFFCTLRIIAGGYHEKTYWRCFFTSFFILSTIISLGVYADLPSYVRMIMVIVSIIIVWIYAPVDHPNKPIISDLRRKKFKYLSLVITILLGGISFLLPIRQANVAGAAIFMEALTLPMGEFSKRRYADENINR